MDAPSSQQANSDTSHSTSFGIPLRDNIHVYRDNIQYNNRLRERMPSEEIPELGDFWDGTVLNLRRTYSISSTSSESSRVSDMTSSLISTLSWESESQNSPLPESRPSSPLPESRPSSPLLESRPSSLLLESGQSSPLLESRQSSPLLESRQNVPLRLSEPASTLPESGQNLPSRESGQNAPLRESGQNLPSRESRQNSPPHEPIRLTIRRVSRPSQESSCTSPLREDQNIYVAEPPAKVRKLSTHAPEDNENDGETCPICLDSWGNSGNHRLVALKCGHLFGYKCLERWIEGTNTTGCCPTCKTKASIKDIRNIYANRLVAVDTTELTAMQKKLRAVKMERNQIQMELKSTQLENRSMAVKLKNLTEKLAADAGKQPRRRNWRFALDKHLEKWRDGGCRVLAYNCRTYEFYVSQKTTNSLFPGYGIRPVSCVDYKLGPLIPLHPKPIRDIAYSQPTDLLMSVGLDGAAKIVERGIQTTSIQCNLPLWSCAWDYARPNTFYVGGVGGHIMSYDVRNTSAAMNTINHQGDMSPSAQMVSTEFGLLSCQLNSVWLWKNTLAGMQPELLPLRGPFLSLCYDWESKRIGVSCRPTQNERAKIALFQVNRGDSNGISVDFIENMYGSSRSTVMSRAAFVKCPESTWVASYSESDSALLLQSVDGGRNMTLPAAEPALDVCAGVVNGETILASLSETRLKLYKAYYSSHFR